MNLRRIARRVHEITAVRGYDPTPPITAEITSSAAVTNLAQRVADLADDLDYYASKTTGGAASDGYTDAAVKIREVIDGTYLRAEEPS